MEEKQEVVPENNSYGTNENLKDYTSQKICDHRCSICASGILKEIHGWKNDRKSYDEICSLAFEGYNVKISPAGLSRHYKSFNKWKVKLATEIIQNDTIGEITAQSVHIRKTVELLDIVYEKIKKRLISNTYNVDISDLEKLAKMRYQILNGENPDEKNLMAIFQKASNDYGLNVEQGVLFKT